jgi:hypothetical protein
MQIMEDVPEVDVIDVVKAFDMTDIIPARAID